MKTEKEKGPTVRALRVGEQVRHILSEILARGDVHDDLLVKHPVSVTEVRMSSDLRHATVFVKSLLGKEEEAVLKALRTSAAVLMSNRSSTISVSFSSSPRVGRSSWSNRTLPLATTVSTEVKSSASNAARRSAIFSRFPPTLMLPNNAT